MRSYDTQPDGIASEEISQTLDAAETPENPEEAAVAEIERESSDVELESTQFASDAVLEDTLPASDGVAEAAPGGNGKVKAAIGGPTVEEAVDESELISSISVQAPGKKEQSQQPPASVSHVQPPVSRRISRQQIIAGAPFWGVILLGAILRFWDLGTKPLHHDESLHGYYSLQLLHNLQNWGWCVGLNNPPAGYTCYQYDPLLHGPFQFHAIAFVYQISQWLGTGNSAYVAARIVASLLIAALVMLLPYPRKLWGKVAAGAVGLVVGVVLVYVIGQWLGADNGVNTSSVRIPAAVLGSILVGLPYFLRDRLGKVGAWLACFLLAVAPSMVYFSRFARESIYMACFTLLLVVSVSCYVRTRKIGWLVLAAAGFALSYATSEATFLTIAIFGSFLGALLFWEVGTKLPLRTLLADQDAARYLPRTFGGVFVLVYFLIVGILAKIFFALLNTMSTFINNYQAVSDQDLLNLESVTIRVLPWLGILLGLVVFSILALEVYGVIQPGRRGLAKLVDRKQPLLDTILTMPWTHWFFALIVGMAIFLLLFSVVFTNIAGGIGDGIWKGLYYWLEQQNVHRGGQPWYYYLLLIPLYEQVGVIFAIAGIVRCIWKPNQFRLFMVYWFLGDFFIYSWAGEKMPWLMIFMTMPMLILAAIGLEPCVLACYHFLKERFFSAQTRSAQTPVSNDQLQSQVPGLRLRVGAAQFGLGLFGVVMAVLLLVPTLHNMYEVAYVEPANGPHEMMIYVQTTTDINPLMAQVDAVDKKLSGGTHQIRIGVSAGAVWPLAWYLRDYPNLCFNYPTACPSWENNTPVVITGGDDYTANAKVYAGHEYKMRSWWDEGYKPVCKPNEPPSDTCGGLGPLLWLDYGDTLPQPNAKFNFGLAVQHIWNWWWYRKPFGSTDGYYPMALYIQSSVGINP
ncbi:MAG TPA: glycosyltransferase family 39 protein [Ktedonobacteraceae bacterium]